MAQFTVFMAYREFILNVLTSIEVTEGGCKRQQDKNKFHL
jgi:hypothetical protein